MTASGEGISIFNVRCEQADYAEALINGVVPFGKVLDYLGQIMAWTLVDLESLINSRIGFINRLFASRADSI